MDQIQDTGSINSEEILQDMQDKADSPDSGRRLAEEGEQHRRKRVKKESDADYDPTGVKVEKEERAQRLADQEAEEELEMEEKRRAIRKEKSSEKTRRRGETVSTRVIELEVQEMIERIEEAMRKDITSNQQKAPAMERVLSMKMLEKKLMNRQIQDAFLQMNGLDHLEKYLFQLPDGSKPSSLLKRKVLELLGFLRLEAHHMKHNHLGQKIMALSEEKGEHSSVQSLAVKLVDDWTRILMDNQTNYKKQGMYSEDRPLRTSGSHSNNQEIEAQILSLKKQDKNVQLLPPKGKQQGFALNPSSVKIKKKGEQMSEEAKSITKLLTDLKRRKNKE